MTKVLTWNIQCGLGVDGRVDLVRIADVIRTMADVDVICLQEVSRFNPELDGGQIAELAHDGPLPPRRELLRARARPRLDVLDRREEAPRGVGIDRGGRGLEGSVSENGPSCVLFLWGRHHQHRGIS